MGARENLSKNLRLQQALRKMTSTEFAESLGIGSTTYQSLVNMTGNPRLDMVEIISDKLDTTPAQLLSPPEPEPRTARLLYETLAYFSSLPPDTQREALDLFRRLVEIARPMLDPPHG